jgi:magnesium transporter
MRNLYTVGTAGIVAAPSEQASSWIDLVNPELEELEEIAEKYNLPLEFLTAALDPDERYELDDDVDATLLLVRIPVLNQAENSDIPYLTRPLALVMNEQVLVTVCLLENPIIDDILDGRIKQCDPNNRVKFVMQILHRTAIRYLRYLRDIYNRTNVIERDLQRSQKNHDLLKLLNFEKSLVFFSTSLRSNQTMMERLKRTRFLRNAVEDDRWMLEDIIIDNTQAIEMANVYTNILSGLMGAFASVISNNLNSVMKTLTQITLLLMLPTLLASLYGMNVPLPFQEARWAFPVMVVVCLVMIIGGYWLVSKRRSQH